MTRWLLFAVVSLVACGTPDADGDGFTVDDGDCDDASAAVHPGAGEVCNGVDDDCDDDVDGGASDAVAFYADTDGDGFGDAESAEVACQAPAEHVADATDCDDTNGAISPAGVEACNDVDDDCDGDVDEAGATGERTWYADGDGDGYGAVGATPVTTCDLPAGHVEDHTDCNDGDDAISPGAAEHCDLGNVDEDCDGRADNADDDVDDAEKLRWFPDADEDGFADASHPGRLECDDPTTGRDTWLLVAEDCDDTRAAVNPSATEVCNGVDDDCDGGVDVGATDTPTWYADGDSDGFGDAAKTLEICTPPSGWVADDSDCDDAAKAVHPGATELCNGVDDDCDAGVDDDAVDRSTWYADSDGDGYGNAARSALSCTAPGGWVADATDCDDANDATWPGADEICDTDDNDCDGSVDEDAVDVATWWEDADYDGYGDPDSTPVESCSDPTAGTTLYQRNDDDCDDTDATISPAGTETCDPDDIDEDCDGLVDDDDPSVEARSLTTWYVDADADGYGDKTATGVRTCDMPTDAVYADNRLDCDDVDADVNPDGTEVCDGIDNDCKSGTSEAGLVTFVDTSGSSSDASTDWKGSSTTLGAVTLKNDGTYLLCKGPYYVALTVEADVTIKPDPGSSTEVKIDGGNKSSILTIKTSGVSLGLEDITLTHGSGTGASIGTYKASGGGIFCDGEADLTLDNVTVTANGGDLGSGVFLNNGCSATITDSTFTKNSGSYGASILAYQGTSLVVTGSRFEENTASATAGGIYLQGTSSSPSSADISDSYFTKNTAQYGAAIGLLGETEAIVSGTTSTTSGAHANTTTSTTYQGNILVQTTTSTLVADTWDMGKSGSSDDNKPYDVCTSATSVLNYSYDDDASFTCTGAGCI